MQTHKLSISLPKEQYDFLKTYQAEHSCQTRSEVIKTALKLLEQSELECYYREADKEIDRDFEVTSGDGISDNETW